jgi:hypothetical protein
VGALEDRRVQAVGAEIGRADRQDARAGERQQPADIGGRDEMPGGTQDVGAQDGAVVKRPVEAGVGGAGQALGQRPLGAEVVLRLHRAQPGDEGGGVGEFRAGELLVVEAVAEEVGGHGGGV